MQAGGSICLARLIDQYGSGLYPDLRRYFGIDIEAVVEGRGPSPELVLTAVRALPDTSLTVALAAGGREHHGWGADRHMIANVFDAINLNTRASGNWGKGKPPRLPEYPRPKAKKPTTKVSLRDVFGRLTGGGK